MAEPARDRGHPTPDPMPEVPAPRASRPFLWLIRLYRVTLSPLVGRQCRFEPTCSRYAEHAYRLHGPVRGSLLTLRRLARCHPLARGGYDPVPIPERARGPAGGGDGADPAPVAGAARSGR